MVAGEQHPPVGWLRLAACVGVQAARVQRGTGDVQHHAGILGGLACGPNRESAQGQVRAHRQAAPAISRGGGSRKILLLSGGIADASLGAAGLSVRSNDHDPAERIGQTAGQGYVKDRSSAPLPAPGSGESGTVIMGEISGDWGLSR